MLRILNPKKVSSVFCHLPFVHTKVNEICVVHINNSHNVVFRSSNKRQSDDDSSTIATPQSMSAANNDIETCSIGGRNEL
jgi:hypothetical protein